MKDLEQIDDRIAQLRSELENVRGTETEVYTRIVGYYRSLKNWNKGKREEYKHRRTFDATSDIVNGLASSSSESTLLVDDTMSGPPADTRTGVRPRSSVTFRYYYRVGCSGCGPVKQKLEELDLEGISYNVDTDEGFTMAKEDEIMATPTVIFFNDDKLPVARVTSAREIDRALAGETADALR